MVPRTCILGLVQNVMVSHLAVERSHDSHVYEDAQAWAIIILYGRKHPLESSIIIQCRLTKRGLPGCLPLRVATTIRPPVSQVDSPCHSAFRHAVSENQKPACAPLAIDQPAGLANAPYVMPMARRLLAEAHQTMFPEPRQLDRSATVMDMILDHRLLISVAALPADGHHRFTVPRNRALRCRADVDAYWAQEEERGKCVNPAMSKNIEPPVSVERSTMAWPPNLDGNDVWDYYLVCRSYPSYFPRSPCMAWLARRS
ncbi:hypothetical protein L210DRAFT_2402177 [Boletus edulis BED1]|uniref:Uncharacterized protein n=1 Tax=Boletus edulis BED1 TaxID=1328754 RepID=A0AAD4C6Y2_BOLED|nr:hypothetical protein L210DRAFT_2402177 [Boletus edulis BED1]